LSGSKICLSTKNNDIKNVQNKTRLLKLSRTTYFLKSLIQNIKNKMENEKGIKNDEE